MSYSYDFEAHKIPFTSKVSYLMDTLSHIAIEFKTLFLAFIELSWYQIQQAQFLVQFQ